MARGLITQAELAATFRYFAERRAGAYAPLYARLATVIADDPALLGVAALARDGQSPPDLLLASVHDLLHEHPDHPAARFYPSLNSVPERGVDPAPEVLAFCHGHLAGLAERVSTRLVQTNEVGRCSFLTPALQAAARLAGPVPLAVIEVGASAGLNLLFDRYGYRYAGGQWRVAITAAPDAPALDCQLRGIARPPVADPLPKVAWRAGIDLNPLDAADPVDRRWLAALIWPDHRRRAARLATALDLAASDPPRIDRGDAIDLLPTMLREPPAGAQLVVFHSAVAAHMTPATRAQFSEVVLRCSRQRSLLWVQAEPREDGDPRRLRLSRCANGRVTHDYPLGCYHPHGEWLEWIGSADLSG